MDAIVARVSYPGLVFNVGTDGAIYHLRVRCPDGECSRTGERSGWSGRWWPLSEHMTDGEIVQTCLLVELRRQTGAIKERS